MHFVNKRMALPVNQWGYMPWRTSGSFLFSLLAITMCISQLSQAQRCTSTCTPDPNATGYANTLAAMTAQQNRRGAKSIFNPVAAGSQVAVAGTHTATQPGSQSYTYAIPIMNLPGRAGLDLNLTLYYNSRLWNVDSTNSITFNPDRDSPSYGFRLDFGFIEYDATHFQYVLVEQDGTKRQLTSLTSGVTYSSTDSSFVQFTPASLTLVYKNGTRVFYQVFPTLSTLYRPVKVEDTNGNYITINYRTDTWTQGLEIDAIIDTLGRIVTFSYDPTSHGLVSVAQGTTTYAQFGWNLAYTFKYAFTTNLTVKNSPANNAVLSVLDHCTLTNGTGYYFTYGDWALINRIDFKSSSGNLRSYTSYNYPTAATALSDVPAYTTQTVFDGVNTSTWQYAASKTGHTVNSMAITDPYGTVTTTTLGGGSGQDSGMTVVPSGGGALRTVATAWGSGSNPTVSSVTTTLNDSGEQSATYYLYDAYANVTEVQEYDYGLVYRRRTVTTYNTDPNYINLHILNLPTQVNLYDETGGTEAIKARTDYLYDETALQSYTATPTQLDSSVTAYRGNVTTVKRYEDPTNLSTAISRASTYDVAGNRVTASLDCCNTRTWTYDSSTQFSYPIASISGPVGTQLSVSATYYPENGLIHTSTDENGQVTNYTYDSSYRLTDVLRPDGIHYGTSYDDAAPFPSVTATSPTDSSKTAVTITTLDGASHAIQQTVQDGAGNVISVVDMAYDNLGRRVQVSLPHASGASPSYTTTSYDILGRVAQVIPPDGTAVSNNVTHSYAGSAITVTDPANKQRKTYNDAFGRIRQVDEPGGTLSSAIITISGTEQVCSSGCGNGGPLYDTGSVGITVNGVGFSVDYGQGSTSLSIASALAAGLSASANSARFSVSQSGTRLTFTSLESGSDTNYAFSASSNTTLSRFFTHPSFSPSPTAGTLSGGSDTTANPSLSAPFSTFYSYDAMDHLVLVKQGLQQRIYVYNGVGRLLSQQTPEGGPVTFAYTTSGAACSTDLSNVCGRTDARGLSTTYAYDGLNRLKIVTYPAGTPSVTLNYDAGGAAAFALGRLTSMSDGTGSETYTYNKLGRTTKVAKTIGSSNYNVSYVYNYIGEVKSLTYPSSRVVTQTYDAIGRTAQIASGGTNYLTVPSNGLTAAGLPTAINYGNGVTASLGYNARLQLTTLDYAKGTTDLLNLTYNYSQTVNGQTVNNGQIQSITDTRGTAFSTSYAYDGLGRIQQAQTVNLTAANTWNLQWSYDRYGNRPTQTLLAGTISVTQPQLSISRSTNRITTAGYVYDANGNMTNDSIHAYAFDAENRVTTVDAGQANTSAYSYDGKGMRVKKAVTVGSTTTTTVYVFSGSKVIGEYVGGTLGNEYVDAGGQLLATIASGGAVKYRHSDHLAGRLETDSTGAVTRTFGQLPFGETWYETGTTSKWKFNTYEHDSESGLDYATFRYDASRLGRFMTPDPVGGGSGDPQSLNRYAYVGNDPINAVDPLGLYKNTPKAPCVPTASDPEKCYGGGAGDSGGGPENSGTPTLGVGQTGGQPSHGGGTASGKKPGKLHVKPDVLEHCLQQLFGVGLSAFKPSGIRGKGFFVGYGKDTFSKHGASGPIIVGNDAVSYNSDQLNQMYASNGGVLSPGTTLGGLTDPRDPYQNLSNNNNNEFGTLASQIHELGHSLFRITMTASPLVPEPSEQGESLLDCVRGGGGFSRNDE